MPLLRPEPSDQLVPVELQVCGDIFQNVVQRADSQRLVRRDRDVMSLRREMGQADVQPGLPRIAVAQRVQALCELFSADVPWDLQTAMTS